ncbi:hypothetical protein P280DRAFT_216560 [Massarina eburnea CBS 473.64]|uniref:Uncharacterized protein n=1 Tax=Massarina eburnea CBS 473.64 TaxID=1395130 RepID=A0A6A6SC89_9PLEO|nr:hypothetical protein P280DRAFT_216560 [Massarina eburnea CBS 473.64]
MNWTGGSLQRSKKTSKGVLQKQKAHFARARTQLQNGSQRVSPFRPSYLRDEEHTLLDGQLPPLFSSRSIRHTGHSKTLREPPEQSSAHQRPSSAGTRKRSEEDVDPEERLLLARRNRLLQQPDWAGLMRSRPAALSTLQFRSTEEKGMIGKRRKLKDHPVRAITKKSESPSQLRQDNKRNIRHGHHTSRDFLKEDISIRIGSEALTAAVPRTTSSISSDTMLFDQQDLHTTRTQPSARIEDHRTFVGVRQHEMRGDDSQSNQFLDQNHVAAASRQMVGSQNNFGKIVKTVPQEEDRVSGCHLAQQVGGVTRPLCLIFDRTSNRSLSAPVEEEGAAQDIGVTSHGYAPANARLDGKGNAHERSNVNNAMAGPPHNADDGAWRPFVAIPDDSSSVSMGVDASETDPQPYGPIYQGTRGLNVEPVTWSRHATQGNETLTNRSCTVSSSLPSITRYSKIDALEGRPHKDNKRGKQWGEDEDENEDEQLWETHLNNDQAALCNMEHSAEGERLASRTIASCNAVRLLSSTPFRFASGLITCLSDSVQDSVVGASPTSSSIIIARIASSADALRSQGFSESEDWSNGGGE